MTRTVAPPGLSVDAIVTTHQEERLTASRARVVAAADETRRRLQHDLHHGAQARLAHTVVAWWQRRTCRRCRRPRRTSSSRRH